MSASAVRDRDLVDAILRSGLVTSRKLVLVALAKAGALAGSVQLGVHRICEATGLSDKTVRRCLADLCRLGMLDVEADVQPGRRDGVIRGHSWFQLRLETLLGQIKLSRAAVVERLNAAWAAMQVRLAKRVHLKFLRSVTVTGADRDRDIASSSVALNCGEEGEFVPVGTVAENRAALAAMYVPPHLRAAR